MEFVPLPEREGERAYGLWYHNCGEAERAARYSLSMADCETVAGIDALARRMGTLDRSLAVARMLCVRPQGVEVFPPCRCASTVRARITLTGEAAAKVAVRWKYGGVALAGINGALRRWRVEYRADWADCPSLSADAHRY